MKIGYKKFTAAICVALLNYENDSHSKTSYERLRLKKAINRKSQRQILENFDSITFKYMQKPEVM
jgi:hypothetical protein